MASILGIVRLAPGRVGYYDELTRIHLTIQNNEKVVYAGMNTENLKKAVKNGTLLLVSGSLDINEVAPIEEVLKKTEEKVKTTMQKKEEIPIIENTKDISELTVEEEIKLIKDTDNNEKSKGNKKKKNK